MSKFSERLKELRTESGLTTRQLGEKLNISHVAIIRWENDKAVPLLDNVVALSKFFNVTVGYMAGEEN